MSDLSNLYISQSYKGIINLSDSTEGITGQTDYELQDGLGNGIGVSILSGSLLVDNDISSSTLSGIGNVETYSASVDLRLDEVEATASEHDGRVEQLEIYTSSLKDAFSVSGTNTDFKGDVTISGSLTAYTIHTITESASVIFSSGSNQLGDEPSDTQIFSGSVYVPNLHYLGTSSIDTNTRLNQIVQDALPSSWTGSVFLPFSSSVSQQIDALELFSQSLVLDTASFQLWTGSVFEPFSASVDSRLLTQQAEIDTKLESSWTSSVFAPFSSSIVARVDDLASFTGSYATTGSNNFFGSQSIDGDVTITGSVVIDGSSTLSGDSQQTGNQQITGSTNQLGNVNLIGNIEQTGSQFVSGSLTLEGTLRVEESASINGGWAVTGSSYYSGSVKGNVIFDSSSTQDPSDFTHSIDCNLGNFFDFYLLNGENRIYAENMSGGETITVRLNQPGGTGSYGDIVWDTGSIKFPFTNGPTPTQGSEAIDILTLVSFDTGSLFGVLGKNYL
jgi:hypothetical protein